MFAFPDILVLVAESLVAEPHIEPVELGPELQVLQAQYIQELGTDDQPFYSGGGSASGGMTFLNYELLNYHRHFVPEK